MALKSLHAKALTSPNVHVPLKSASHVHLPGRTCQFWLLRYQDKLARLVNQILLQIAQIFYSRMFGMKSLYLFGTVQKVCLALMRGSINPISGSKTILLFGSRLLQQWWFALSVITIHGVFPFAGVPNPNPNQWNMSLFIGNFRKILGEIVLWANWNVYRTFCGNQCNSCRKVETLERCLMLLWK